MQQIVINSRAGGFGLSDVAKAMYKYLARMDYPEDIMTMSSLRKNRDDPYLISVICALGDAANDKYSQLKIVEIPDDVEWAIQSADNGVEWITEVSRNWS